jgi:hypothetical protein
MPQPLRQPSLLPAVIRMHAELSAYSANYRVAGEHDEGAARVVSDFEPRCPSRAQAHADCRKPASHGGGGITHNTAVGERHAVVAAYIRE